MRAPTISGQDVFCGKADSSFATVVCCCLSFHVFWIFDISKL